MLDFLFVFSEYWFVWVYLVIGLVAGFVWYPWAQVKIDSRKIRAAWEDFLDTPTWMVEFPWARREDSPVPSEIYLETVRAVKYFTHQGLHRFSLREMWVSPSKIVDKVWEGLLQGRSSYTQSETAHYVSFLLKIQLLEIAASRNAHPFLAGDSFVKIDLERSKKELSLALKADLSSLHRDPAFYTIVFAWLPLIVIAVISVLVSALMNRGASKLSNFFSTVANDATDKDPQ